MLSPRQMFLLDNACWPIRSAFIDPEDPMSGLYLVGSTMTGEKSNGTRDTDVRLMLSDRKYESLRSVVGMTGIRFLGIAIGQYIASITGLPIDFQLQQTTAANDEHGPYRNPLGTRDIDNFIGDGEPKPAKPASYLTEREEVEIADLFAKLKPESREG